MGKMTWCLALVAVIGCGASTRGETRRGVVLAENGSPAIGAHVWATKLWVHKLERVESQADDQGRFSVTFGPGEWIVHANLGDQGLEDRNTTQVSEGHAHRPLILRLTSQGRLRGQLVEAESGTYGLSVILQGDLTLHRETLKLVPGQHIERMLRLKPAGR